MKKVKFMLMSLALIAVVGGALAFKAKMSSGNFCSIQPFHDAVADTYYCTYNSNGIKTTDCGNPGHALTTTVDDPSLTQPVLCVSATSNINLCSGKKCPVPIEAFANE